MTVCPNLRPNLDRDRKIRRMKNFRGFTLIELLVVIAMVSIVLMIATPSFKQTLLLSEIRSATNDWIVATQTARAEAVRRREQVTICPSSNGSTCATSNTAALEVGWIMTLPPDNHVLQDFPPRKRITMTGNKSAAITYLANGMPVGNFAGIRITVQEDAASPDTTVTRYICVARSGRARVFTEAQYLDLPNGVCE